MVSAWLVTALANCPAHGERRQSLPLSVLCAPGTLPRAALTRSTAGLSGGFGVNLLSLGVASVCHYFSSQTWGCSLMAAEQFFFE